VTVHLISIPEMVRARGAAALGDTVRLVGDNIIPIIKTRTEVGNWNQTKATTSAK
jgi:hypothetical protein